MPSAVGELTTETAVVPDNSDSFRKTPGLSARTSSSNEFNVGNTVGDITWISWIASFGTSIPAP